MSQLYSRSQALTCTGIALAVLALTVGVSANDSDSPAPPKAPIRVVADKYFGVKVPDPYRYMEDLASEEVRAWFRGQNDFARTVLSQIPARKALLSRIKDLDESAPAEITDVRRLPSDRYFYQKRLAAEDVSKLYFRDGLGNEEKLLVDPKKFTAPGGPHSVISYYAPSLDGKYVAAGISAGGSEDAMLRVFNASTGSQIGEAIDRAQFGNPSWLPDGRSFVYNRLQKLSTDSAPTDRYLNSRCYLHVLGTDPDKDLMIFGAGTANVRIEPSDIPFIGVSPNTSYAFGIVAHGVRNEVTSYFAPLDTLPKSSIPWKLLYDVDDEITGSDVYGDDLYLLSHHHASRFKVLHTKLSNPDVANAKLVVSPSETVIRSIAAATDGLYLQELDGGIGRVARLPYSGAPLEQVRLPFDGAVNLSATDQRVSGALFELASWTTARKIYAFDPARKTVLDTRLQPAGKFDSPADLESREVKVKSQDGTLVPLSIIYRKGLKLDGSNSTLLEGYGAYGITFDPFFDPKLIAWYERGGIYAVAHIRGGGEYGEDWHLAGKLLNKPNTWKDFIACAEYLIAQKYTSTPRLAIRGGSAGGITVGRAVTERPELFAVVIDEVPSSDTVRGEFTPNGPPNIPEFGTVKDPDGFKALYEMSSYHHITDGTKYPAILLTTGFNDPRVVSWQPGKMAARLQAATSSGKPILLRVDYDAGHGIGSTKTQDEELLADILSFTLWQFGAHDFQPVRP